MFRLPELDFGFDALEPVIDAETMRTHYLGHHATYVEAANVDLELLGLGSVTDPAYLLDISDPCMLALAASEGYEKEVERLCFNAGGHLNHSLFWEWLSPEGGGEPPTSLRLAIERSFGNMANFRAAFEDAGLSIQGSGWVWLAMIPGQRLGIYTTPNQETPWTRGFAPILGVDCWEHAYYLNYLNVRADYLSNIWEVIDWATCELLYSLAMGKK